MYLILMFARNWVGGARRSDDQSIAHQPASALYTGRIERGVLIESMLAPKVKRAV
jgi:hypothetical protein